jgi:predicted nucleotidyltransferase
MTILDVKKISRLYESMYYNKSLNTKFWKDGKFDEDVRKKLVRIAQDFYDALKLTVSIHDIQLTGSLANYNYTKYSDLDIHIIIDFRDINEDEELVKRALDGARFVWNQRHNVVIRGHDVELYIQDESEQHTASGLYSLLNSRWVHVPRYNPPEIDERDIDLKEREYTKEIIRMEQLVNKPGLSSDDYKHIQSRSKKLRDKIQQERRECLSGPEASEFCVENLVFKNLRNSGMIGKLIDITSKAYDLSYSE